MGAEIEAMTELLEAQHRLRLARREHQGHPAARERTEAIRARAAELRAEADRLVLERLWEVS